MPLHSIQLHSLPVPRLTLSEPAREEERTSPNAASITHISIAVGTAGALLLLHTRISLDSYCSSSCSACSARAIGFGLDRAPPLPRSRSLLLLSSWCGVPAAIVCVVCGVVWLLESRWMRCLSGFRVCERERGEEEGRRAPRRFV